LATGLLVVDAAAQKAPGLRAVGPPRVRQRPLSEDAGDGYLLRGRRVTLHRSLEELVVVFASGIDEARQRALVDRIAPGAELERKGAMGQRGMVVVRLDGGTQAFTTRPLTSPTVRRDAARQREEKALVGFRAQSEVRFTFPVLIHPATGGRLFMTDEVLVRLAEGASLDAVDALLRQHGLTRVRELRQSPGIFILRCQDPQKQNALEAAEVLGDSELFATVEPNLMLELQKQAAPNDPMFGDQWHLHNTGQTTWGTADADVDAPEAWDLTTGDSDIQIAIIDDGIQIDHPDLAANVFTNEAENTGLPDEDDDGNGYDDDVHGWDFWDTPYNGGDNDPSPASADDNHGTSVTGVAAAVGDNATGISGACPSCQILPVRIGDAGYVGDYVEAIQYGGTMADVVSCSWSLGAEFQLITDAITDVNANGRGGLGTPVLFASANGASGMVNYTLESVPAGTHLFRWDYAKDNIVSAGDDTAWIAWIVFPDGTVADFTSGSLPAGFTTGGNASWSVVDDPVHADEGGGYVRAAKAGAITHNQSSWLQTVRTVATGGTLYFYMWVSSEQDYDGILFTADYDNGGPVEYDEILLSGVPDVTTAVAYPASVPASIAVGASTDIDYRSDYSEFGSDLDFVASSNGGPWNAGVTTTDRTGSDGYEDPQDYTSGFGGTSSATPLASGVAGLMLSRNPDLTSAQVRQLLRDTADEVGPETYVAGRNDRYGHGRINAYQAVLASSLWTIDVVRSGSGGGTVSSSPAGIDCGAACSAQYLHGTEVTLTAAPDGSSVFLGWLQPASCVGTGPCVVTVGADTTVEAEFATAGDPCVAPPGFNRLQSAAQGGAGSCAVGLDWSAAVPVCGSEVSYSVFRSTTSGFVPGLANRIAAGLSGITYTDTAGLAETSYYYVVRATDTSNGVDDGNASQQAVTLSGCTETAPAELPAFTVTAEGTSNHLNWLNPVAGYDETVICHSDVATPSDPTTCSRLVSLPAPGPGQPAAFAHTGRTPGTTTFYRAWVHDGATDLYSGGVTSFGRPPDATQTEVAWAYTTGASAFAPAGVVPDTAYYQVSNDRGVHAMLSGTSGGMWPAGWAPLSMNDSAEGRPLSVTLRGGSTVLGRTRVGFVASQDGRVYAFDAESGEQLWVSEVLLGTLQGAVSAQFVGYGADFDLVIVGTRTSGAGNALFGLRLADGTEAWRFDGEIGMIASQVSLDVANNRAYFTSYDGAGGSPTVWCVSYTESGAGLVWSRALGDVAAPPILRGGVLYVGTTIGQVHALDPATGTPLWADPYPNPAPGAGNPVIGLWVDTSGPDNRVFFTTGGATGHLRALTDGGSSASELWAPMALASPSSPLLWQGQLYVGAASSQLWQIAADGTSATSLTLGGSSTTVGRPTLDVRTGLMMMGSGEGVVYAVQVPF
jgi:subtilisin family serine protease/outer membrane protein assembly factor BamB